jgi:hypothetical protein
VRARMRLRGRGGDRAGRGEAGRQEDAGAEAAAASTRDVPRARMIEAGCLVRHGSGPDRLRRPGIGMTGMGEPERRDDQQKRAEQAQRQGHPTTDLSPSAVASAIAASSMRGLYRAAAVPP